MKETNYKLVNAQSGVEETVDRIEFYPTHVIAVTATIGVRFEKNGDELVNDSFLLETGLPTAAAVEETPADEVVAEAPADEVVAETPADEVIADEVVADEETVSDVVVDETPADTLAAPADENTAENNTVTE